VDAALAQAVSAALDAASVWSAAAVLDAAPDRAAAAALDAAPVRAVAAATALDAALAQAQGGSRPCCCPSAGCRRPELECSTARTLVVGEFKLWVHLRHCRLHRAPSTLSPNVLR
jgi:hypothetical protein